MTAIPRGLAGVKADTTAISHIDGEAGELLYRGYPIDELARHAAFAEVVGLVLDGELPDAAARRSIEDALARNRTLPPAVRNVLREIPALTHPMTVLQSVVPLLDGPEEKQAPRLGARGAQREILLSLCAKLPTAVAAWSRVRAGREPVPPDPALPIHEDFLRMVHGERARRREVEVLDVTQILQMEHGFNASTFTGRTVASTLSPASVTLSACIGALAGPLHGGADEAAYRMALAIGTPDRAAGYVDGALSRREKIMGLGHREYRVVDPRAVVLKDLALELGELKGQGQLIRTLMAVDEHAERRFLESGKRIRANVEFYKGAVFAALGLAPDFFTCLFVMARAYGWAAHALELWDDHSLYRPAAEYTGAPRRHLPV